MDCCEKIDAFEKHVLDRQLYIAQVLGKHFTSDEADDPLAQSAFAVISIAFSYFEMIEQFAVGQASQGQSATFFKRGFARVFSHSLVDSEDVGRLYSMVRCGMYHTAMPTDRCGLTRELPTAIANENGVIVINPALLVDELIAHFRQFCSDLRDGRHCDLRRNFEEMFDSLSEKANTAAYPTTQTSCPPWEQ